MDVQLPHLASAGSSNATGPQSTSRQGSGGSRRESAGSGKSFSSELQSVHTAQTSRHEAGRSQSASDEHDAHDAQTASDQPTSATTASTTSSADRGNQADDKETEPARPDSTPMVTAPPPDVTTQSVLLALIAQPTVITDAPVPMQTAPGEQTNTAMESVMPSVMEDGTSLPVTAADSSTVPQVEHKALAAASADSTAAIPSGATLQPSVDTNGQQTTLSDLATTPSGQAQPTPGELRTLQQEKPTFPLTREEQPHAPATSEVKAEPMILPTELRSQVREDLAAAHALTAEQIQRSEDNRPLVMERPIPVQDTPAPKEEDVSRQPAVALTAWQEAASQKDEGGMEWSGHDHRERPSAEQTAAQSIVPEASAPAAPSNPTLVTHGVDHRAFSSAPSGKLPADTQPAATLPPVQSTDWMPGNSTGQTKSMVLELSQADLGRVNIRVAVNQETVHTHFSSERNELGQYLMNGQDRLQSALTASGLDLGRFQVDIDRQSAGRSFEQPTSRDQSPGHALQEERQNSGRGREETMRETTPRRGMLNLVA